MQIRRRVLFASLWIALPAALVVALVVDHVRLNDRRLALDRVLKSQINEQVRERCEGDPTWFMTGPLIGRPKPGDPVNPDPNAITPRARYSAQGFELFAYDEAFLGSSTASPRFPLEYRRALQTSHDPVTGFFPSALAGGVQEAMPTGWIAGPCMYLLARMPPPSGLWTQRWLSVIGIFVVAFVVAIAAVSPTVARVRRLATLEREAIAAGYASVPPDALKDELSSLTFMFNDAATELHARRTRIGDQDVALRRFVESTEDDVSRPLAALEQRLGALELGAGAMAATTVRQALENAHDLSARVENLTAAARLRMSASDLARTPIDLNVLVTRVAARHAPLAHAANVQMTVSVPKATVAIDGDEPLVERAVSNVLDNAIRYGAKGGQAAIVLTGAEGEKTFRLRVSDRGPGLAAEEFKTLTANRRFRGDEGRNRRPGAPGLGLAVAREVADRFKMYLELRQPDTGGFEAEFFAPPPPQTA